MLSIAYRPADEPNESVARLNRIGLGARVARPTSAVHFTRSYARKAKARAFLAPDGPVTIPYSCWSAVESMIGRHNSSGKE